MVAMLLGIVAVAQAQTLIKGTLVDRENGEPLIGARVQLVGENKAVVTDIDGAFELKNPAQRRRISVSYVGYKSAVFDVPRTGLMGRLEMDADQVQMQGVTVFGTMAFERKTPVALSNVTAEQLEEKQGTQEFVEVLKSTPGVHANKQGGGYGDSEIFMRGFGNDNIATMVNGVPMNDMEWGGVYWSNWAGLSDVARVVQTQRGLGASKVSAPSVGGTINIITRTLDQKRGGNLSYALGSDGYNKVSLSLNTGMNKKGWGMSLMAARTWGQGYVQGTDFVGYNWFISVAKKFNEHHTLSFTGFGSPQEHGQRSAGSNYGPMKISEWARVKQQYGDEGYRYNAQFGYLNGQPFNANRNRYHKPQLSLNHDWSINKQSSLSTVLYTSIGRGSGSTAEGHGAGSYQDINGVQNGMVIMNPNLRTAQGFFNYDYLVQRNAQSNEGSVLALCNSVNNHIWTGLLSTYTNHINEHWDVYGGLDFRYYNGTHKTVLSDLLGGAYFMDDQDRSAVSPLKNSAAADPAWKYEKLHVGDVVYRNFKSYVVQEGLFGQAEYNTGGLSAYVNGALNTTSYWKRDFFYYDKSKEKSDVGTYLGGNIKAGANYNFNDHHNAFVNVGYISRAPKFNYGAFVNPRSSNVLNRQARNEKVISLECGYGYRWNWGNVKLNAYYTQWKDKTQTKSVEAGQETGFINMTGVGAIHKGVEMEIKLYPAPWIDLSGMLSLGDWRWNGTGEGYIYDNNGNAMSVKGERVEEFTPEHGKARVNVDGVRVGGSAQTTAAIGANFKISRNIRVGADWTYYGRNFSYYTISTPSAGSTTRPADPWKVPAASQVDLNASYKFTIGKNSPEGLHATLSGNITNLFDYRFVSKAYNPAGGLATRESVYVFYQFGRTYSLRLKLNF